MREAEAKRRRLDEILTICSFCKRIRNDAGAWARLESFFTREFSVRFSHSICPECMRTAYPEHVPSRRDQDS